MLRIASLVLGAAAFYFTAQAAMAQDASEEVLAPTAQEETLFSETEIDRIRAEALAAILAYPEVIEEALAILEARRANDALAAVLNDPNTPILGNPDADITLVEFFDYNCGYCRRMAEPLQDLLAGDGNLRVVMIETPILSEESLTATQASLGAAYLGADYSDVHFEAMIASGRVSGESVMGVAEGLGIDPDELYGIMDGDAINDTITRNYSAMQALDISGTPAFIVAASPTPTMLESITMLPGAVPVEELRATIDRIRLGS